MGYTAQYVQLFVIGGIPLEMNFAPRCRVWIML